jgi:small subunit ribosomal protein S4
MQYNVSESQMRNYFKKAARLVGNTGDILIQLIETRLDALVVRAGFANSIYAAKQYVSHGHILVNGRRVNVPSYQVKPNDVIAVKEKSRKLDCFQESLRSAAPPPYMEVSKADFSFKFLYMPPREEVPAICELPLVVEFYSR